MITVRTEKEAFTVKLPEKESQETFWKVIDILRNPDEYARKPEPFCEKEIENLTESQEKTGYTGFLHIVCPECGESTSFCTKSPATERTCRKCGHNIQMEELVEVNMDCECGKHSRYKTNSKEQMLEINCINCGTPVAMSWNEKRKCTRQSNKQKMICVMRGEKEMQEKKLVKLLDNLMSTVCDNCKKNRRSIPGGNR